MPKFSVTLTLTVTADDMGDAVHAATAAASRADRPLEITNVHAQPEREYLPVPGVGTVGPLGMDPEGLKEFGKAIGTAVREMQREVDREDYEG
jgi:hypothetical protein